MLSVWLPPAELPMPEDLMSKFDLFSANGFAPLLALGFSRITQYVYICLSPAKSHGIIVAPAKAQSRGWSVTAKKKATILSMAMTDVQTF